MTFLKKNNLEISKGTPRYDEGNGVIMKLGKKSWGNNKKIHLSIGYYEIEDELPGLYFVQGVWCWPAECKEKFKIGMQGKKITQIF